ncbi:ynhC [Wigglesworthia glossinidia endosymbiont of Glossina brevipalpis]|uniref:YnhC protein n=1 Tax=Wigglesworthia glossinidia brevipalpis TaxID=36870 RepID=Q8D2J6_WIGBR|nr:ynhC [Wigglesworthia glossinidia endosymbiont of Glossina brevipalpis]
MKNMDMDGLKNNMNKNFIKILKKIFLNKENSKHSEYHWNKLINLKLTNKKNKYFKFINIEKFFNEIICYPRISSKDYIDLKNYLLNISSYKLIFINGFFCNTLSDKDFGNWKITRKFKKDIKKLPKEIKSDFFLHCSESLSEEITHIYLKKEINEIKPLYLINIGKILENKEKIIFINNRNHIEIGNNSKCQIIEHFINNDNYKYLNNSRTTIHIKKNSFVDFIKINQNNINSYNFSNDDFFLEKNSNFSNNVINLGGYISKQNINLRFNKPNSNVLINSLSIPIKNQIVDIKTFVEHKDKNCKSRQLHKFILSDRSKGIFHGKIKVEKNAVKTDGHMKNNNILLGEKSSIITKPQLEIYTDDVKCSHGATTNYLDSEYLFYLRSRGISKKDAKILIICSFYLETIKNISCSSLFNKLDKMIFSFLEKIKI